MQVESIDTRQLTTADALAIAQLLVRVWPESKKTLDLRQQQLLDLGRNYQGSDARVPRCFVVREAGQVIAHSTFVARMIGTSNGPVPVAGLALVCSDPQARGRGLGEAMVRPVFQLVDDGTFAFSLFQTSIEVQPFYERLGAVLVDNPIINSQAEDPRASPFASNVVMRYRGGPGWPEGEIDLCGAGY